MVIRRKKKLKVAKTPIQRAKVKKKKSVLKARKIGKEKTTKDIVALIDIEIILYQVCCDCLEEKKTKNDEWSWVLNETDAKTMLKNRLDDVVKETKATRIIIYFGSISNWRKKIDPEYKAHRQEKKPLGYIALKEWLKQEYPSQDRPHMEADDLIGVVHTTLNPKRTTIAVSSDKDFKSIPGKLYNPSKPNEGIKEITLEEANDWHIYQTLVGDVADGYKGCPGVGDKGALALIGDKKLTYKQKWDKVKALFKKAKLSDKDCLVQARLARICRFENYNLKTGDLKLWKFPK